jgi:hypothetical protein
MNRFLAFLLLLVLCQIMLHPGSALAEEKAGQDHLYVTWQGLEPDKCASAWLIKRFVDKEARFVLLPPGTSHEQGVAFDMPSARFRATHRSSTFDSIYDAWVEKKDVRLEQIRRIIKDLEFNKWEPPVTSESRGLQIILEGIRRDQGENVQALESSMRVFDWLYAGLHQ